MSDIICITDRKLCKDDFLQRISLIAQASPKAVILREKDMTDREYGILAEKAADICKKYGVPLILHNFVSTALQLGAERIHLPLHILRELDQNTKSRFSLIGASCHSTEEAAEAQLLGADYITAGHVFATDCKKGLEPRGLDFLKNVCTTVNIPVYAIGGISAENIGSVRSTGAAGACIMSGFMQCSEPKEFIKELTKGI